MNALVVRLQDRTSFASDDQADYAEDLAQELIAIKFQIQLPKGYPNCHEAPQIELVNRFLPPFHTDESVRHAVQDTFSPHGAAPWTQGEPVLFQGIDTAYELVLDW